MQRSRTASTALPGPEASSINRLPFFTSAVFLLAGCVPAIIYYSPVLPIRPPSLHAPPPHEASLDFSSEPPVSFYDTAATFVFEDGGPEALERFREGIFRLEKRIADALGPAAEYRKFFLLFNRALQETSAPHPSESGGPPYPDTISLLHAVEGRSRNCLALTILFVIAGEDLGIPVKMVLTRGHTMVLYDDGVNSEYFETTGGFFYHRGTVRRKFFPKGQLPSIYLRALSPGEAAAVFLANRALERFRASREAAFRDLSEAERLFPELPLVSVNKGFLLEQENRLDEALACYEQALKLDPDNPYALNNLAALLLKRGDALPKALSAARKAVSLMPSNGDFVLTLKTVERAFKRTSQ